MNLRQAARLAYLDRVEAQESTLLTCATRALREVIGDVPARMTAYNAISSPQIVEFMVDDVEMRVTIKTVAKHHNQGSSNVGLEYDEEIVTVDVKTRNGTWTPVESLADIGNALKSESIHHDDPTAADQPAEEISA